MDSLLLNYKSQFPQTYEIVLKGGGSLTVVVPPGGTLGDKLPGLLGRDVEIAFITKQARA